MIDQQKTNQIEIDRQITDAEEQVRDHYRIIQDLKTSGLGTRHEETEMLLMLDTIETIRKHQKSIAIYVAAMAKASRR
jgi:hypothetical protein